MQTNNLYSLERLQALDAFLKLNSHHYHSKGFYQKDLKLIIQFNNDFWYGDFVQIENNNLIQHVVAEDGEVYKKEYDLAELPIIYDTRKSYADFITSYFFGDPLTRVTELSLAFNFITQFLDQLNLQDQKTSLYPYLFNARTLDGKQQLPFLNLKGEKLKLVSIYRS